MKTYALSALIALSASLLADDDGTLLSAATFASKDKVIIQQIKGIVLVSNENDVNLNGLSNVVGLEVKDLDIPGNINELKAKLEPYFMNKQLTQGVLVDLKKQVVNYYRDHDRPIVVVEVPEQDVTQGVVKLVVIESQLGEVTCQGNKHFSDSLLKKYIRIKPGEGITSNVLLSDIAFMNRNYFRRTDAIFAPGKKENTTDIVLVTKDRLPWRFYTGGDNTGTKFTGNARWFGGLNWGNVFGWDHIFSYQYTTSSDFHKFQSHTFHYAAPTRYHHTAIVYGGFSHVHPNMSSLNDDVKPVGGHLDSKGFSSQASFRYEMPVGSLWNSNLLQFVLGFDYKHMNNNLEFIGDDTIPIIYKSVNLTQLVGAINYGYESEKNKLTFEMDTYWSPGPIMGGGSNHNFNNLRNRAKNHYVYGRFSLGDIYHMPQGWDLSLLFRGQASDRALLPSEQFGLGGYNTVRGYDEREFNADNAVLGTFEIHCPTFSLFKWSSKKQSKDHITFLVFGDYARGWNYKSLSNERKDDWLASVGPGVRYSISRFVTARVDWGIKLHKDNAIGHHYGKVHVSVIASY